MAELHFDWALVPSDLRIRNPNAEFEIRMSVPTRCTAWVAPMPSIEEPRMENTKNVRSLSSYSQDVFTIDVQFATGISGLTPPERHEAAWRRNHDGQSTCDALRRSFHPCPRCRSQSYRSQSCRSQSYRCQSYLCPGPW